MSRFAYEDGLTEKAAKKKFLWLFAPDVEAEGTVGIDRSGNLCWKDGTWKDGIWEYGLWKGGIWENGTWKGGDWTGGDWHGGTWKGGIWYRGTWYGGTWVDGLWGGGIWEYGLWKGGIWENGTWKGGIWKGGLWRGGTWEYGLWEVGTWKGGTWKGGTWHDGTWHDGTWDTGLWDNGTWKGGTWWWGAWMDGTWESGDWRGGTWYDGTWYDGTWGGGDWKGGYIDGERSSSPPKSKSLAGMGVKSDVASKSIRLISDPVLYRIADLIQLYLKPVSQDDKIPIKDIKSLAKKEFSFAQLLTKKSGVALVSKFPNGFSILDIVGFDKGVPIQGGSCWMEILFQERKLRLGLSAWDGGQRVFHTKKNQVFQVNLVKSESDKLVEGSRNLTAYVKGSNHPTSKNVLTLSWVRFTQFDDYVVLDEIQTDLDGPEYFGKSRMTGWEKVTMRLFVDYVRHKLGIRKIYMPTYKMKLDDYVKPGDDGVPPPMYLYKELPSSWGFRKVSSDVKVGEGKNVFSGDNFMVLENLDFALLRESLSCS